MELLFIRLLHNLCNYRNTGGKNSGSTALHNIGAYPSLDVVYAECVWEGKGVLVTVTLHSKMLKQDSDLEQ